MRDNNNDPKWIGQKFNRLTVIGFRYLRRGQYHHWEWECKCDCGNVKTFNPGKVKSGHTQSCGCIRAERLIGYNKVNKYIHGGHKTRLNNIWHGARQRCENPTSKDYKNYGGRGIRFCSEWQSFDCFRNWAMNNGYDPALTLDRIDTNGNYEPDNCRWTSIKAQCRNKRTNVIVTVNQKEMTLAEACDKYGMPYQNVWHRLFIYGWTLEEALSTPVGQHRNK